MIYNLDSWECTYGIIDVQLAPKGGGDHNPPSLIIIYVIFVIYVICLWFVGSSQGNFRLIFRLLFAVNRY